MVASYAFRDGYRIDAARAPDRERQLVHGRLERGEPPGSEEDIDPEWRRRGRRLGIKSLSRNA